MSNTLANSYFDLMSETEDRLPENLQGGTHKASTPKDTEALKEKFRAYFGDGVNRTRAQNLSPGAPTLEKSLQTPGAQEHLSEGLRKDQGFLRLTNG